MGQKGQILANRLLLSTYWLDIWYNQNFYHNSYFQIQLIKEFLKYFFLTGILVSPGFNLAFKQINLVSYRYKRYSVYQQKFKKKLKTHQNIYSYFTRIKGVYYSKIWVLKLAEWVIISVFLYNFKKKKFNQINKFFRLFYFYKSYFLINNISKNRIKK